MWVWPLYTYNPTTNKLILQSKLNEELYKDFLANERRFMITIENGKESLLEKQKKQALDEYNILKNKSET